VGHGTQVKSINNDEADSLDEAYYFEDGALIDDILLDHLIKFKNHNSSVILISDCCHSGSIWDLTDFQKDLPPRVISISAAQDQQTSKQIVISKEVLNILSKVEAGVFTSGMYDALKENQALSPIELKTKLDARLKRYQQTVTVETTSPEMLNESLFLPLKRQEEPVPEVELQTKPQLSAAQAPSASRFVPRVVTRGPAAKIPYTPSTTATELSRYTGHIARPFPPTPQAQPLPSYLLPRSTRPVPPVPAVPPKKYQQPVITYFKNGKKIELHRYYTKMGTDETIDYDVISTTLENNGMKPIVTHSVEITRTDQTGRVRKVVHKYGNDLPWHAAASKWNSPPVVGQTPAATVTSRTVALETSAASSSSWGKGNPYLSQALKLGELPPYYLTGEEKERMRTLEASLFARDQSIPVPKQVYSKISASNMTYGYWYVNPSMTVSPL
jgi:hypothetical protein